jgi:hypothetical protein
MKKTAKQEVQLKLAISDVVARSRNHCHSTFQRKALPDGLQYRYMGLILGAIIAILSFLLGAVLRPYLTGYASKKGENLAAHEDIDKLVDQIKAVTEKYPKLTMQCSAIQSC